MRLSNYFLAFFLFFLLGCNKEAIIKDQYLQSTNNENHEVSHEEVLKTMESVIQLLAYPRGITKSQNVRREIANIKKITPCSITTKSSDQLLNRSLYIVNFTNDNGYTIISGDKRSPEILAIIEKGNLDNLDSISIKEKKYPDIVNKYLLALPQFQNKIITNFNQKQDSIFITKKDFNPDDYYSYYTSWRKDHVTAPMLITKWGQKTPFNYAMPVNQECGHHALAGCIPVAIGQLFSYYKWPTDYNNKHYNWEDDMMNCSKNTTNAITIESVSSLLYNISIACKAEYRGCNIISCPNYNKGTGVTESNICPALNEMGYNCSKFRQYSTTNVISAIENKRPVLVTGWGSGGHGWIIDGYSHCSRDLYVRHRPSGATMYVETERYSLLHCNYGWDGLSNGYYISEVFDVCHPIIADSPDYLVPPAANGSHVEFIYSLRVLTDITPKK